MNSSKLRLLIFGFLLLFFANTKATTAAEECQKQAMRAYDKGSTELDKQQRGAAAASVCITEMERLSPPTTKETPLFVIIIAFIFGGVLIYRLAINGDSPLSKNQIRKLRDQVRNVLRVNPAEFPRLKEYKKSTLEEVEKMFALALSGNLPISGNSTRGMVSSCISTLRSIEDDTRNIISASQAVIDASMKLRDSAIKVLSEHPLDEKDKEEMECREIAKRALAKANQSIEEHQQNQANLRGMPATLVNLDVA